MDLKIPLDIPNVEIIKFDRNQRDEFIITVTSTARKTNCHKCGKAISKVHGYSGMHVLRHTSILGKATYIRIKLTRYKCEFCDDHPTTTEQPEWFTRGSQFTKSYEEWLMRSLINSTLLDVARKEHLTYDGVEGALNRQISTEVNWKELKEISVLGIDEIAIKKGHKDFVAVITARIDLTTKIIAILPDRKKETVKAFLKSIPDDLKKTVRYVCSDMYQGYINAAKEVFGTKVPVVIDRFHVAKIYRKCVDELRKEELRRLKKELSDAEYKQLKGAMWALRKKEENLSAEEKETVKHLFHYSPQLKIAYNFQKSLTEIFNQHINKTTADKLMKDWIRTVQQSSLSCFDKFIVTLQNHWNEILNYFYRSKRKNSGFVEGLNNRIKTVKRRCYGILKIDSLFQRIYLDLEGYAIYA